MRGIRVLAVTVAACGFALGSPSSADGSKAAVGAVRVGPELCPDACGRPALERRFRHVDLGRMKFGRTVVVRPRLAT